MAKDVSKTPTPAARTEPRGARLKTPAAKGAKPRPQAAVITTPEPTGLAARRLGLLSDRTRAARNAIEHFLSDEGPELFARASLPGLVVHVRFADGRTIERCYGTAGGGAPVRSTTLFQVLSLSKPITALAAAAFVDDGVLAFDEPVFRRLRSFAFSPSRAGGFDSDGITLRRLLSHDAGLAPGDFGWAALGRQPSAVELLEGLDPTRPTAKIITSPGSGLRYSGIGYALVQLLVEEATGRPFADVVRERVLAPLGIVESGFERALTTSPELAVRHDAEGRPLAPAELAGTAASGFVSTACDLATLWALPFDGRGVLSAASSSAVIERRATDENGASCGLGFFVRDRHADRTYMHLGYGDGLNHQAFGLAHRGAVAVVLSNGERRGERDAVSTFAFALRKRLFAGIV